MVKDIPVPKEILQEFEPFGLDKKNVAKLFDNFDYCVLCDDHKSGEDMPSQNKGQNCLDKYFPKVTSKTNINDRVDDMGKINTKNNAVHKMSSSSGSETEIPSLKNINQKSTVPVDENSDEGIEFDSAPSKPIIAAMNALGKLKQGIAEVKVEDNSSRDSTALVIDEEQLEPGKVQSSEEDEPDLCKTTTSKTKSGDVQIPKGSKSGSHKTGLENESLSFSQFLNTSKNSAAPTVTTSTPVETKKGTKRKRNENAESEENPSTKRTKDRQLTSSDETWLPSASENMDNLVEIKNLKDGDCPLFLEDFNSDDELYVVQCPKEVDLQSIVGKQVDLNGESLLNLEVYGKNQSYECYSQKESMGRYVNMILPSRSEGILKFGVYPLNGSIVLSQSLADPDLVLCGTEGTDHTKKEVTTVDSLYCHKTRDFHESKELSIEKHKKHKKKHDISKEQSAEEGLKLSFKEVERVPSVQESDSNSSQVKKKKKKRDKTEERATDPGNSPLEHEEPSKKKKKVKEEGVLLIPENEELIQEERKGKMKSKNIEEERNADVDPQALPVLDEQPVKKKKKRKHRDEPPPEVIPAELEVIPHLEEVPPHEQSPHQEGTTKKKKKKKDKEKIEEPEEHIHIETVAEPILSTEEPLKKKKKKKHLDHNHDPAVINLNDQPITQKEHVPKQEMDEGVISLDDDLPSHLKLSTFIETDTQHIKKKKKKKKKKEREKSLD